MKEYQKQRVEVLELHRHDAENHAAGHGFLWQRRQNDWQALFGSSFSLLFTYCSLYYFYLLALITLLSMDLHDQHIDQSFDLLCVTLPSLNTCPSTQSTQVAYLPPARNNRSIDHRWICGSDRMDMDIGFYSVMEWDKGNMNLEPTYEGGVFFFFFFWGKGVGD